MRARDASSISSLVRYLYGCCRRMLNRPCRKSIRQSSTARLLQSAAEVARQAGGNGMRQPPSGWLGNVPPTRAEVHFDGRLVRCFAERPKSAHALLEEAVIGNPAGEAVVCGKARLPYLEFAGGVARPAAGARGR